MSAELMLAWWNLLYIVPFLLALLYLAVYAVSGVTFGEGDMEMAGDLHADVEGDFHADIDHDVDADIDHDLDGDADADGDAHLETPGAGGSSGGAHDLPLHLSVMSWLGLGRVPLSILIMVLFITWGVIGFITNVILSPIMPWSWMSVLGSIPAAAIGSLFITRGVVRLVGHWMPTMETYARRTCELVGTAGEAMYDINQEFGMATVRDSRGDLFQVSCHVYPDGKPISKGTKVLLVDYDEEQKCFFVTPYDVLEPNAEKCTHHAPP